ncbi:MAG TPA: hypothetical protein VGD14_22835 [bacterium]
MSTFKTKLFIPALFLAFVFITSFHFSASVDAQTGQVLTYKASEGDILKYQTTRKDIRSTEREGQSSESTTTRTFDFQLKAEKPDSLLSFVLTINKFDISSEGGRGRGFQPFDPQAIQGKRVQVKITPQGDQREITAIDSLPVPERPDRGGDRPFPGRRGNPLNQLRINFCQLPAKAMKVGDSWTEPYKDIDQSGGFFGRFAQDQKVEGKTTYTVLGEEKKDGLTCLHIKIESTYSRSFEGERQGNKMSSESEGETKSEVWFAPKEGVLVEYVQDDFNEGTTAFSGRTTPSSNESKFGLKLLEWKPKK